MTSSTPAALTIDECFEYVDQATQSEGEQRAEYGSGAVSLGYDPSDWASDYDGYRVSGDPTFVEAARRCREYNDRHAIVKVIQTRATSDSIPF